jgi:hypothetical protein
LSTAASRQIKLPRLGASRTATRPENRPPRVCRCRHLVSNCAQYIGTSRIVPTQSTHFATETRLVSVAKCKITRKHRGFCTYFVADFRCLYVCLMSHV